MKKKISGLGDLFSDVEEISPPDKKISVTFAEYKRTESVEPDDLFKGFNELRAVTFSAGINQVEHFMKFFERGEVIIGSPQQVTADFAEMIALQKYAVDYVSENSFLRKMIKEQKFKNFFIGKIIRAKK